MTKGPHQFTFHGQIVNIPRKESSMLETIRYVRKPFTVDAVQVKVENIDAVAEWVGGSVRTDSTKGRYVKVRVESPASERQTKAFLGDWVLYSGKGYKVFTNRAFKSSFQIVVEEQPVHKEVPASVAVPGVYSVAQTIAVKKDEIDPVDELLASVGEPVVRKDS